MKKTALLAIIGALFAFPIAAQAQTMSPTFYAGANVGSAETKVEAFGMSEKESKTGFKINGGVNFTDNFGAEVGYVDLGKFSASGASYESRAIYLAGTGTIPLNPQTALFAKVGVTTNRAKISYLGESASENNTSAMFGIGASYSFTPNISAVAEYENFGKVAEGNGASIKANMFSVGLRYKF